jgi:hypothetical protein
VSQKLVRLEKGVPQIKLLYENGKLKLTMADLTTKIIKK